jgi:hypothetical protein
MFEVQEAERTVRNLEAQLHATQRRNAMPNETEIADRLKTAKNQLAQAKAKQLAEQSRIERLKGPRGGKSYVPPPPSPQQIEADKAEVQRQEKLKQPTPLPPAPERDLIQERQQHLIERERLEKLKGA